MWCPAPCAGPGLAELLLAAWDVAPAACVAGLVGLGWLVLPLHEASYHALTPGGDPPHAIACAQERTLEDAPEGWGPTGTCALCGGSLNVRPRRALERATREGQGRPGTRRIFAAARTAKEAARHIRYHGPAWVTVTAAAARDLALETPGRMLLGALPPRERAGLLASVVGDAARSVLGWAVMGGRVRDDDRARAIAAGGNEELLAFLRAPVAETLTRWALEGRAR
jgi:hypothetical protein